MKQLPEKFYAILAEDVRPEPGNKLSVLGFHAAPIILLPDSIVLDGEKKAVIDSICPVFIFLDGQGDFEMQVEVFDPGNHRLFDARKDKTTKEPKKALTLAFKYSPFPIPTLGEFRFLVTLDKKPFEFRVQVALESSVST